MLGKTDNIVIIQNNTIRKKHRYNIQIKVISLHTKITKHKTSLNIEVHHYNITKQHGNKQKNIMTLQNYLIRHNTIL